MVLTDKLLNELQRRLKIGNRRGVHLNAIPANSRYKFDLHRLSYIDKELPNNFIKALLSELPLKFRISWKDNVPDLNSLLEEDQSQLVRITKAFENLINQTEAIESEKGINTFGFGFPILVRRDRVDNKLTVAPILIWSLRIKRTKEFNTWEILRNDEDPIYINEVLINHLQSDANIEIGQIPSDMLDDGLINESELIEICSNLIRSINTIQTEKLEETFKKKLEIITSIRDKNHYEKLPLNSTNSFIDFGGLFSIFEVQKQNIIDDYSNLMELEGININLDDFEEHIFQPISSIETDPSQQSVLHSLETKRNILIQGPPGTGKSQTLTAVLINALENKKKTIVVCEKRTALEVLHNAIIDKGLNYHSVLIRDIVKDRKIVVDSVRDRIENSEYKFHRYNNSKESLNNLIIKASNLITDINNKHLKLDEKIIGEKSWSDIVGNLLAEKKDNEEDFNLNIEKNLFSYSIQELNAIIDILQKGQILYSEFSQIEIKSFINSSKFVNDNPYLIEQKINDDYEYYSKQLDQIKLIFEKNNSEYIFLRNSELKNQIESIKDIIIKIDKKEKELSLLVEKAKEIYFNSRKNEFTQQISNTTQLLSKIDFLFKKNEFNNDITNQDKINSLKYKFLSNFSKTKKEIINDNIELQKIFSQLENNLKKSKDLLILKIEGDLEFKRNYIQELKKEISIIEDNFNNKIEIEFNKFDLKSVLSPNIVNKPFQTLLLEINFSYNSDELKIGIESIHLTFKEFLSEINSLFHQLSKIVSTSKDIPQKSIFNRSFNENKEDIIILEDLIDSIKNEFEIKIQEEFNKINLLEKNLNHINLKSLHDLQEMTSNLNDRINEDNWTVNKIQTVNLNEFKSAIEELIKDKNHYFDICKEKDIFTIEYKWYQFYNSLSEKDKIIIDQLKGKNNWKKTFLIFYLNSLLINSANLDLPTNDIALNDLKETLNGIEKEQIDFIKKFWYSKQRKSSREFEQNNSNLTVENLYNKRSSNRFKRLSLRQIVQYNADLFTDFFPIILTSPDVASNLFKGMNGYFDIVMFDEASQLRLEDNLPAIIKGKQIIIAGDEHQMPPSNYFSKVFDGTIDDEEDFEEENEIIVDKDNILLSCESLLDFGSELNFQKKHLDFHYRSRHPYLIDFSNYAFYKQRLKPIPNNFEYVPIKYVQVNGTFSEHTNDAEAEMVLSIIENNINRLPDGKYPTIGIATFNITQRNLIKSKILERQKFSKFLSFNNKIQELEENGMFIKNLENIQGDERDVIILSTTYGVGKDNKFTQRFGPINHSKGYKLLNVIITRAKFKIYCCTSIPEDVFMNYKEYLMIEGSNNKRAVFFAYLAYCKAVSETNDDLRISVLTTLAENTSKSVSLDSFIGGDLESPFEEEVYQSLVEHFGTEKLIPQLQFAGFRIDIVYDSKIEGMPKIAIECDGAKYHSSREAYLYDRHRQKILENHGFIFHRIWSTNWWRNSNRETKKLIDFINEVEVSSQIGKQGDQTLTKLAFTDDILNSGEYLNNKSTIDVGNDLKMIETLENPLSQQTNIFPHVVKLNSLTRWV